MPELPNSVTDSPTVQAIYKAYAGKAEKPRRYLGASIIGKACARALWYEFRWCGREEFSGRMLRLFQTGSLEEVRIAHNLREIGCEVHVVDESGQQFGVSALGGHFRGHMDGVVLGLPEAAKTWHLLEAKTHNAKSFAALKAKGVREAKPEHFAQMQIYMHLAKLERALYFAVNKDTDELHTERVKYDFAEASRILGKARSIIEAKEPPERIGAYNKFPCMFCCHKDRCHGSPDPASPTWVGNVTCRNCVHATPVVDEGDLGAWRCEKHQKTLSEAEQEAGCEDHLLIPALLDHAFLPSDSAADPAGDWIEYTDAANETWRNGKQKGHYRTVELTVLAGRDLSRGPVSDVKQILGGAVVPPDQLPF